jgi:hypothetical protein
LKRYRPQILLVIGAVITMASISWELVRMNPNTTYLVEPWSRRGYQSVHGSVIFTIGGLALIFGLLTMLKVSLEPLWSRLIALVMGIGVAVAAILYGGADTTMGGGVIGWAAALLGAYIVASGVRRSLPDMSSAARVLTTIGVFVVAAVGLNLLIFGTSRDAGPWVWVTLASALAFGLAATGKHPQLSANRMLMLMTTFGWIAIAVSAAAARTNLIAAQRAQSIAQTGSAIVGDYKDVQVTSGYFIALFGMLVAFIAAVSMWAKRRDIIINQERAERQRAAAEASAAEIKAALEIAQRHQREARAAQ